MPIYRLHPDHYGFPERSEFEQDIIAVGGDLAPGRLIEAYCRGVFPWYNTPGDLQWFSPQERCVLPVDAVRVSHSMRNVFNRNEFSFSMDTAFVQVMEGCRGGDRIGQTWIFDETVEAYSSLHKAGLAHSLEVYKDGVLVGGLYGLSVGSVFFGESMFSAASNASKAALIKLSQFLPSLGITMIDCQVPNDHLMSLGGQVWERNRFLDALEGWIALPTEVGKWETLFQEFLHAHGG
ncbi:MAG: leucyl/phenylalanyl-tRNA--protein transferase [Flavobacteriales bacterium]|jgi:leucyl/phenylalanyl-tRNA--protein transferase